MESQVKRTSCRGMDDGGCGLLVTVQDGHLTDINGDKDCPLSKGFICYRAKALSELVYHPQRIIYPMRRLGERGSGEWQNISWNEALDLIHSKFSEIIDRDGAKSILFACGSPKGLEIFFVNRLASLLGTPNVATPGNVCHMPRELGCANVLGAPCYPDLDNIPEVLILWGINPRTTNVAGTGHRLWLDRVLKSNARIVCIDPRKTDMASRASLWARIRPGADGALALALLKIIVEEKLYDHDFVTHWTSGWDELLEYLSGIELQKLAEICWLEPTQIWEIAHIYASNKPAVIFLGNAIDHTPDSFQTARTVAILKAITGNIDIQGGEIIYDLPPVRRPSEFTLASMRKNQKEMLGAEFKIAQRNLFVPRQLVAKAILEEKPYPIKAMLTFDTNPLLTYPDSSLTYKALKKLEFLAVSDFFMTPTAELADLVLPNATFLEYDEIGYYNYRYGMVVARPQVITPVGECWSDIKVINELGKTFGFTDYFWEDVKESLDYILEPSGLTFEQFKDIGILRSEKHYAKHKDNGFRTPSGKVEVFSQQLYDMGYSPLPVYTEPPASSEYPLVLTCAKSSSFYHSGYRQLASLRKRNQEPVVEVNPDTATRLGLQEGDYVNIATNKGSIKQRLKLNPQLDPRVIFADYGWWFPEQDNHNLHGWQESNLNMLTDADSPAEPAIGSTYLRGIPCRLSKS